MKLKSIGGKCFLLPENVSTSDIVVNPLYSDYEDSMSISKWTTQNIGRDMGTDDHPGF